VGGRRELRMHGCGRSGEEQERTGAQGQIADHHHSSSVRGGGVRAAYRAGGGGSRVAPLRPAARPIIYNRMVVHRRDLTDAELDRLFRALADATRRDIVRRVLAGEPASVSTLAA